MGETSAIKFLKKHNVEFEVLRNHCNKGIDFWKVVEPLKKKFCKILKIIFFRREYSEPFVVMYRNKEIPEQQLAKVDGLEKILTHHAKIALNSTEFQFDATSSLGTPRPMRTFVPAAIFSFNEIYVNRSQHCLTLPAPTYTLYKILDSEILEFVGVKR